MLLLYPADFRKSFGRSMLTDLRHRSADRTSAAVALRLPILALSLFMNAIGAWRDQLRGSDDRQGKPGPAALSGGSWLDIRLGLRMLRKNPVLTLASVSGIAVAVAITVGFGTFFMQNFYPDIPLDEGQRIVGLENWDLERGNEDRRALWDFRIWRTQLQTVHDLTAFRTEWLTLPGGEGEVAPVTAALMTPSGFDLARVPPLSGRYLIDADAHPGAAPVLVVGYEAWQSRFGGDPELVGSEVLLGNVRRIIVGIMPPAFAFPVNHQFWIPLVDVETVDRGGGADVFVSGRLAPGVTMEEAQAEFAILGARLAVEFPDTHGRYRAQLMPYAYPILDINEKGTQGFFWETMIVAVLLGLLVLVVCVNVAVLVYARTAMRFGEMAIRSALGASRTRIIGQLFMEGLVLATVGTATGLLFAGIGLDFGLQIYEAELGAEGFPFWMDLGVSPTAIAWVVVMTVMAAVVIGVLPGLKAASGGDARNLSRFAGRNAGGLGFAWTILIVIQVAVSVALLPVAMDFAWSEASTFARVPRYDPAAYVGANLLFSPEPPAGMAVEEYMTDLPSRWDDIRASVGARLQTMPGVGAFSFADFSPVENARTLFAFEADTAGVGRRVVGFARVDQTTFENVGIELVAGRGLVASDYGEGSAPVVVVDRAFAESYIGSPTEAVGRRLARLRAPAPDSAPVPGRLHEIVGVVENLFTNPMDAEKIPPRIYFPLEGGLGGHVLVRASNGDAGTVVPALRRALRDEAPELRVSVETLEEVRRGDVAVLRLLGLSLGLAILATLLLTSAGIYALMSSAVTGRRREIGVRVALGARRGAVLRAIFVRAAVQIGVGVTLGATAYFGYTFLIADNNATDGVGLESLAVAVILMTLTGAAATWAPARRGLSIQPAEVMKSE